MSDPILKRMFNLIYPVGAIYESTKSDSPATLFGGTWTKIYEDYDYIYAGSQTLYDSWTTQSSTKTALLGAYDTGLFQGIFKGRTTPPGYTQKIGCTAQFNTGNSNEGRVYLNSKLMCNGGTWSGETFRIVPSFNLYTLSEIGTETTLGYSRAGVNLYVQNTGAYYCIIRNITAHGYFVSNDKKYKWKRTA